LGDKLQELVQVDPEYVENLEILVDMQLAEVGASLWDEELQDEADEVAMSVGKPRARVLSWGDREPTPGWNTGTAFLNPRTPAVPASLELTLEEYFAAAALVGILGAQQKEPDMAWASKWANEMGATMAAEARKRRRRRTAK